MAQIETLDVGGSIRLGQFLKLANVADTGGMSRELIAGGLVSVNGEVDLRRGRQLTAGDVVRIDTGEQVVDLRVG
ncbi:MAG: RNA-binding S4 domain-containing protein [Propionibacteriaceae bacterium]|nr:RNA-binding S4 domain-containing protein [Propionibacteriaceae bacterium]